MNHLRIFIFLISTLSFSQIFAQNALINILTQKSGIVKKGEIIFLEITIDNTDANSSIQHYKLKPQITVPSNIVTIDDNGHKLPDGWSIISNDGSNCFLTNGTDVIPPRSRRIILIAIRGDKIGGPSTLIGQLFFSNGESPGLKRGTLTGDNPADNSSTSTIKVVKY